MTTALKGVVFDLDGVITDTAHYHYLAWKKTAESIGIEFDEAFNENLKGVSRIDSLLLILRKDGRENDFTEEQIEALAADKNEFYVSLLQEITPADVLPGIKELIVDLKKQNLKCAIASVSKNARTVLSALEMEQEFDYIVDAAKITKSKPDPEIFVEACRGLGLETSEVVGIEDAQAGIEAINAAGIVSVGVGSGLRDADMTVKSTGLLDLRILEILHSK
ncbi:TPA: beta-phosphoglucomutase [Listeria monocytogenes]|uniref:Beta-phosphoglucomutase n=3 Tax=Listeria monocytogenes TaxID=1639 RepID=A0A459ZHE1_LISMN|nr:beta-phosphoglucomutase [Listeria monocytogenes]EAE3751869.1 beta-phosphoglucomutase [Listeria monocytogenes serotype 1/2a]EAF4504561.1 beta-phosphoglucomutase [Listeria monocytogenes serotype 4b]EAG6256394.1 beta-phosphoglucomutase [Listeria monocytogenes CFSAN003807]EAG6271785.1 beta-phosphoglucomutase [Listeria monocytogenes CFSAN003726]EAG6275053.1 beta-phosphoglucomutase [Listeria monocytogenes CFSAN003808]EAG6281266.1 beta-phosphoglucomutase [Listeria monocytogenes CFSAN003809]EAG63